MSFWFRRKDKKGRVYYVSVSVPLLPIITLVGLLLALLIPLIRACVVVAIPVSAR